MKIRSLLFLCFGMFWSLNVAADSTLYDELGGQQTIAQFVSDTIDISVKDERIAFSFKNSKLPQVKEKITNQICELTGGPCKYKGVDMEKAHVGMGLNTMHFNALVENLQEAMRNSNIPSSTQYKLLALLAPMHGDVIETKEKIAKRKKAQEEKMRRLMGDDG